MLGGVSNMTETMLVALATSIRQRAIFAGRGRRMSVVFPASVLRALYRRGLVTLHVSPDGGMMAFPTKEGINWRSSIGTPILDLVDGRES